MTTLEIVLYPDTRLRAKNLPVEVWDQDLRDTTRAMFELMYGSDGVGLAAPQVGINRRLLVFNPEGDKEHADQEIVLCNPIVVSKSKEREFGEEGCLSFPELRASILRPLRVAIEAKDIDGKDLTIELSDWKARIFLHEFDHLDGILFIDRMTPAEKAIAKPLLGDLEYEYRKRANN